MASVIYHDSFWYPFLAKNRMAEIGQSEWGRLFQGWEHAVPDEQGFPDVGQEGLVVTRTGLKAAAKSFGVLGTSLKEAPEFVLKRKKG